MSTMTTDAFQFPGESAAGALAPETDIFADPDVAEFGRALSEALRGVVAHPLTASGAGAVFVSRLAQLPGAVVARWLGSTEPPPVRLDPKDRRFADPAWTDNPAFYGLRLLYQATSDLTDDLIEGADLSPVTAAKARMATRLLLDAIAPTNFLATNPAALKRAFDTAGLSLMRGAANFVDDALHNGGRPRQVDTSGFTVGVNLAATPGKVVYRNDLMELIQYEPQTPQVHANPLLCSPPWINKYYVMDLAPGRSFIEWAVQHGRTVFAISYRNPSSEMSGVTLDDYLLHGPQQALDVIEEITGAETIDIVGLCLGGALTVIADAYLSDAGDTRLGTLTLLNTMVDYSEPGPLGMFTDERTVARVEQQMAKQGHLPGKSMASTFDILRANDLIFNYVVSNWLLGQQPPAFDILAWNSDATRMPAAMHSFYLRNFYVENKLAKDELEIRGQQIRLSEIKHDTYIVSAENDHIVPWRSAYRTTHLLAGQNRFVLSSGGHIAGIVNPPGPKGWYEIADETPPDADQWRSRATRKTGSWWEDWAIWSEEHSGPMVDPPPMGSDTYPAVEDSPGRYVLT
jgi:polyhydroxyalkanoate synthase subunit PhaC